MKKVHFLFPLLFVIAIAGAAFTQPSKTVSNFYQTAYYTDQWNMCQVIVIADDACTMDAVGYPCMQQIPSTGHQAYMYQWSNGFTCMLPYYSYF